MKKISFNDNFKFTNLVLNGDKIIDLSPVNTDINKKYHSFTIGSRITGLNGYKEWKDNVIKNCKFTINEKLAISQPYKDLYDINDENINKLSGFLKKSHTSVSLLKNHITITNIDIIKLKNLSKEDMLNFGIKRGCDMDFASFKFVTKYYYHYKDKVYSFNTIEECFQDLCTKLYKTKKDNLFYKISFKLS